MTITFDEWMVADASCEQIMTLHELGAETFSDRTMERVEVWAADYDDDLLWWEQRRAERFTYLDDPRALCGARGVVYGRMVA